MELYADKIAQNERKIQQLTKNIKRDTEKRRKLIEENDRLSYLSICGDYNCSGRELLKILAHEHQQAEKLKASGLTDKEIDKLTDNGSADSSSADVLFEKNLPLIND